MFPRGNHGIESRLTVVILAMLCIKPVLTGYSRNQPSSDDPSADGLPEFDQTVSNDVRMGVGQTVYLPCTVRNLGDKLQVSWIRTRDLHILTHGPHTFTADQRFDVLHAPATETWTLRIKKSRHSDSGRYECQVNTDPKIMMAFNVTVKDTPPLKDSPFVPETYSTPLKATIAGPREQLVKAGSTVAFECQLTYTEAARMPRPSRHHGEANVSAPRWLHNKLAISFQADRGGISVEAERSVKNSKSRLTVASVTAQDAGQYTCDGDDTTPDSVNLVVAQGEHMEAMQRDQASNSAGRGAVALAARRGRRHPHAPLILRLADYAPRCLAAVLSWLICIYDTKWRWHNT